MCTVYSFLLCFFIPVFSREITLSSDEPRDLISRRLKNFVCTEAAPLRATQLVLDEGPFVDAEFAPLLGNYETFDALYCAIDAILSCKTVRAITVLLDDQSIKEPVLTLRLARVPLIGRISIKTSRVEKNLLRSVYPLVVGDPYDAVRHAEGVVRIKELLDDLGYRAAHVVERIEYDDAQKLATIFFEIDEGVRVRITTIDVASADQQGDTVQIARALALQLTEKFSGEPLSKEILSRLKDQVKRFLFRRGYHESTVEYHETLYRRDGEAALSLTIRCGQKRFIEYIGCHAISRDALRKLLERFGKTLPYLPATLLCEEIAEQYRSEGYRAVQVSYEEVPDELHIIIVEGPKTIIQDAYCVGGASELAFQAKKLLNDQPWPYSDVCRFQKRDALIALYTAAGYWDAAIVDESITDDGALCITLELGRRRFLRDVVFHEIPDSCAALFVNQSCFCGAPISRTFAERLEQEYAKLLKAAGYRSARPRVTVQDADNGVVCTVTVEGDCAISYGNDLVIDSASRIPSDRLRALASGVIGAPCTRASLDKVADRLRQTGVFSAVSVVPKEYGEPLRTIAHIMVVDDAPHEVRARAGSQLVGQNFEFRRVVYKVGGSWFWKNPTARADTARIDVDYLRYRREVQLWYSLPWATQNPLKTDIKVYTIRYDQPFVIGSPHVLYEAFQNGMLCSVSGRYDSLWSCITGGLEFVAIGCISEQRARELVFDPRLVNRQIPYAFLEPSALWEQLDNKIDPAEGYRLLASCKALLPFDLSRAVCFKAIVESALYKKIGIGSIAVRLRMGHIFNEDFERVMPIERFYLGGSYSLRGYEPDLAPPVNQLLCEGCRYPVPIGGRSMALLNAEWRVPLSGVLQGVLFSDCGALESDRCAAIMPRSLLGDTGFGLRLKTPVGPLRFDIAWKWQKAQGECPYMWYITLGNAF